MLPLSLEDLLNYTTLMIKFCTSKLIGALLLRQGFFRGGKGPFCPQKRCNAPSAGYRFPRKKTSASSIRIVGYCKYDMYFNKYDMYSIVGIDKKTFGEGIGKTYIHT